MSATLRLPYGDGGLRPYTTGEPREFARPSGEPRSRVVYAAAHVVADPLADNTPGAPAVLDWDATLAFRRHLWSYGLRVAEAMDTAQRGMGLDWAATRELIERGAAEAAACGGGIACGVGTDQLAPGTGTLDDVIAAYEEQLAVVEAAGADVILMASRRLAAVARGPEDYAEVYGRLLGQVSRPVILHWLGPMFDPALDGYWGSGDLDEATGHVVALIGEHAGKIAGIKVSLLDAGREIALRRRLPAGVKLFTGDDFNYPELIRGDERGHSDALLGVFDPIAPAAAAALAALDAGDISAYDAIFEPTLPLARKVFEAPTFNYKTGVVFLAWLAGHQDHFRMVSGLESARSLPHLAELFRLADAAGLLPDPDLAAARMRALLAVAGVSA
ncbi:dihydrodipicolinate synthase family protein [Bailinhaonella thermotolerans]|uniref:Dihydrodipicolinate synthase family protein n=1 Tax=Bailinhaonella thermotolerans TaxID=1070861 RepID=A0A3A4AT53_9ACTN|nr:dihydrodipicolinate synthase family protein [Bailinhaonella thermotolerans]RJL31769.1 dihydrodipicolinate synthase family protein [Bailinhaonella thermotolerans]